MKSVSNKAGSVAVIGSLNIDYIASVSKLPKPGETISATGLVQLFGGKGANQATAAARQGARTAMIGCLGKDGHGDAYAERLKKEGIDTTGICRTGKALTGTALIAVEANGENNIIVAAGANGQLKPKHVRTHAQIIASTEVILTQFEIPLPTIIEAFRIANRSSTAIVLNPSPIRDDFPWGRFEVDTLIVNEGEARILLGGTRPTHCLKAMSQKRIRVLVITRGAKSTFVFAEGSMFEVPGLPVKPIDTVGAGDAFAGAYAAWRASGAHLPDAVRYSTVAGALTTLKHGAQEAMPTRNTTVKRAGEIKSIQASQL